MTVVYEKSFDANEWFVIISLIILNILVWSTPKIFSVLEGTAHYIYGFFMGMFYDHTISVRPWDFYDVNDISDYQIIDFLSYAMYSPYSYFFMYLYVKLRITRFMNILYILTWTGVALLFEWIGVKTGVFHYDKGYKMYWSLPIYLITLSLHTIYYHIIKTKESEEKVDHSY